MKKILLLSLTIGLAGAGCMSSSSPAPSAVQPTASVPTQTAPAAVTTPPVEAVPLAAPLGSDGFTVTNQASGPEVTIADAVAARTGFIAVYKDNNGKPGALAGTSQLMYAGETRNVPIHLKTASKTGETYWATLFVDNGDKNFNEASDVAAKDSKGATISSSFKITQ